MVKLGKRATIKDVSREAGVSISVVSYILNNTKGKSVSEPTRERILEAAKRLNYIPNRIASGMRTRKSLCIGIVSYWGIDGYVIANMLTGINQIAAQNNYRIVICPTKSDNEEFKYIEYFYDKSIDGIIFISPYEELCRIDEEAHISRMKAANIPFVIINGSTAVPEVNYINIDYYGSTYLATNHMIDIGQTNITYVTPDNRKYSEYEKRYAGYSDAMKLHGLPEQVCFVPDVAKRIRHFQAVVANKSDTAQLIINEALNQSIRIPDDFPLIAANTESFSSYLYPPLTTVRIPSLEMGELAVMALLGNIIGKTTHVNLLPPCSLQVRASCP